MSVIVVWHKASWAAARMAVITKRILNYSYQKDVKTGDEGKRPCMEMTCIASYSNSRQVIMQGRKN